MNNDIDIIKKSIRMVCIRLNKELNEETIDLYAKDIYKIHVIRTDIYAVSADRVKEIFRNGSTGRYGVTYGDLTLQVLGNWIYQFFKDNGR